MKETMVRQLSLSRWIVFFLHILVIVSSVRTSLAFHISSQTWASPVVHVWEHLLSPPSMQFTPLEKIANTRIPTKSGEILAFLAKPSLQMPNDKLPVLLLIHEFFGLNESIQQKAQGLADELGCVVVAPDTFRGTSTDFIPKAIWLAVTTSQDRVNDDLDAVCQYLVDQGLVDSTTKFAIMGFCYGGGKAIRYAIERRPDAATVVCYGSPVTNVNELNRLKAPVCGIFGREDVQFPGKLLESFQKSLDDANVVHDIQIYDGVGHAFWSDMKQIEQGDEPQTSAFRHCTTFLRKFFFSK